MSKERQVKQWITIKGNHIPVYEGQTVDDAAKNFMKHEGKKPQPAKREDHLTKEDLSEEVQQKRLEEIDKRFEEDSKKDKEREQKYNKLEDVLGEPFDPELVPEIEKDWNAFYKDPEKYKGTAVPKMVNQYIDEHDITKGAYDKSYKKAHGVTHDPKRAMKEEKLRKDGMSEDNIKRYLDNEEKADALERELDEEMSSTEDRHSVGWRREMRDKISELRRENKDIKYGRRERGVSHKDVEEKKSNKWMDDIDEQELEEIVDRYNTSTPVSGDWDTETEHEQKAIASKFDLTMDEAKEVMKEKLGFEDDDFKSTKKEVKPVTKEEGYSFDKAKKKADEEYEKARKAGKYSIGKDVGEGSFEAEFSGKNEIDQDKLDEIADRYVSSYPISGSWDTETAHEQKAISKELGVSMEEAKRIMIDDLGFDENEKWAKAESKTPTDKKNKTEQVTKAIKEKASNNSYLSKLNQEQLDEVALDGDENERKQAREELKRRGSSLSEARERRKTAYAEYDAKIKAKKDANKQAVADIKAGLKEYGPKRGMWQDPKKADKEWDKVRKAFQNGEIDRETYEKIYNMFGENFHRSYKVRHMKNR